MKRALLYVALTVCGALLVGIGAWCCFALYFSNLPWGWLRTLAAICLPVGVAVAYLRLKRLTATAVTLGAYALVIVWFLLIPASNDRNWVIEQAVVPYAEINGNLAKVCNIRNFDYRTETDFDVRYYDRTFDLDKIETVDLVYSYWDNNTAVAHTMLSFDFSDGTHLCVSAETRKEKGEAQTAVRGLFKQYEIIFILGDERDLLRLRTDFRGEEVYLFPTTIPKKDARILFLALLDRVNQLHEHPEFYNTLTGNCTTTLLPLIRKVRPAKRWFDIRVLRNGESPMMAYENGGIDAMGLTFDELKKRCHINQYTKNLADPEQFSSAIRQR